MNTYPHERLNTSGGVVMNKDLSLSSITEIRKELKETKCDRYQKNYNQTNQTININTYILTLNNPKPPPEIKIAPENQYV